MGYRFDITPNGQQIHIAFGSNEPNSKRHPCFKLASPEALLQLQTRVYEHFVGGKAAAPLEADEPGGENSGEWCYSFVGVCGICGVEY